MPIYAYRCTACGHQKDVLQKISDAPLSVCPSCGASAFAKQVTAAGFQLKGSGWYVTDFRNGSSSGGDKAAKTEGESKGTGEGTGAGGAASDAPAATPAPAPASASAAPSSSPAGGCGSSCACH